MSFITFASITWTGYNFDEVADFLRDVEGLSGMHVAGTDLVLMLDEGNVRIPAGKAATIITGTEDGRMCKWGFVAEAERLE